MSRKVLIAIGLLVSGCARDAVRTPEQAKTIALSSACAKLTPVLALNEQMPMQWLARRRGDRWYVWLPYGAGAQLPGGRGTFPDTYGHFGAWISPKDGAVLYCERGGEQSPDTTRITLPPLPQP